MEKTSNQPFRLMEWKEASALAFNISRGYIKLEQMNKDVLVRQISFAKGYKWALHDVKSIIGIINNKDDE